MTEMNGKTSQDVGRARLISDRRQVGGLMLLLGACATFQPLSGIVSLVGVDSTATGFLEVLNLIAGLIQLLFGSLAMVVGYLSLVHDSGNKNLTIGLIALTQFAWLPYILGMVEIGMAASGPYTIRTRRTIVGGAFLLEDYIENPFLPEAYLPTVQDVRFFGSMGILGVMSYGVGFLGSLSFLEFSLLSFDSEDSVPRNASYYRGRLLFYALALTIAGASQLLLGGYGLIEYGTGPLDPPVGVAMYQMYFPEFNGVIGLIQMFMGYFGVFRYLAWTKLSEHNNQYQWFSLVQWMLMLGFQYLVQFGYGPGEENSAQVTSFALMGLGLHLFPAFLDYKMRTTPKLIKKEHYGSLIPNGNIALLESGLQTTMSGSAAQDSHKHKKTGNNGRPPVTTTQKRSQIDEELIAALSEEHVANRDPSEHKVRNGDNGSTQLRQIPQYHDRSTSGRGRNDYEEDSIPLSWGDEMEIPLKDISTSEKSSRVGKDSVDFDQAESSANFSGSRLDERSEYSSTRETSPSLSADEVSSWPVTSQEISVEPMLSPDPPARMYMSSLSGYSDHGRSVPELATTSGSGSISTLEEFVYRDQSSDDHQGGYSKSSVMDEVSGEDGFRDTKEEDEHTFTDDAGDDSTAALVRKLEELENDNLKDPIQSFEKALSEIL